MVIKSAYYLRNLPTRIAVVLPDGSVKVTALTPFRRVIKSELAPMPVMDSPVVRRELLRDEIPQYIWPAYGFEREE